MVLLALLHALVSSGFVPQVAGSPVDATVVQDYERAVLSSGLFDAAWYANAYPDVAQSGLSPIQHFLRIGGVGGRDPGPNFSSSFYADTHPRMRKKMIPLLHFLTSAPKDVAYDGHLVAHAALKLVDGGADGQAITLARRHLPKDLMHTLHLLSANAAQAQGQERAWVEHVNRYLAHFGAAGVRLGTGTGTGEALFTRLSSDPLPPVAAGPIVTVILPAHNAEASIEASAQSILNQTWRALELIIVDDASNDRTWEIVNRIAERDSRVRLMRNKVSTGPYIAKNSALLIAKGDYVTGHDADDWSHPQRLERQMAHLMGEAGGAADLSLMYMLRVTRDGRFAFNRRAGWRPSPSMPAYYFDGLARLSFVSALFRRDFLASRLGSWDSVRYAADADMIFRATLAAQGRVAVVPAISMLCLDRPDSLTGGVASRADAHAPTLTPVRREYSDRSKLWWQGAASNNLSLRVEFPLVGRPFPAPASVVVPLRDVCGNLLNMPATMVPRAHTRSMSAQQATRFC